MRRSLFWSAGVVATLVGGALTVAPPAAAAPSPVTDVVLSTAVVIDAGGPRVLVSASWTLPPDATGAFVCLGFGLTPPTDCASFTPGRVDVPGPGASTTLINDRTGGQDYSVAVVAYAGTGQTSDDLAPAVTAAIQGTTQPTQPVTTTLLYGKTLTVTDRLTRTDDGSPVAGAIVDLVACPIVNKSCPLVAHLTTDANGVASRVVTATNTVNYRFVFRGSPGLGGSIGLKSLITKYGIRVHITRKFVRVGHPTYLWGTLTPTLLGARVYLAHAGVVPKVYVKVFRQKMPNGIWMTGFKLTYKPTRAGKYKVTAVKLVRQTSTVYIAGATGTWFTVTAT